MKRYVEVGEIYEMANDRYEEFAQGKALQDTPTADVTEIIRCKDCKWFNHIGCAIEINEDSDRPSENDYCSFAERKDEE